MGKKVNQKRTAKMGNLVLGIDPGITGAMALTDGEDYFRVFEIPLTRDTDRQVDFDQVHGLLSVIMMELDRPPQTFLERAVSFGMGTKSAFNYGRGFAAITIALGLQKFPFTLVEPNKWAKQMHEGTPGDMKPKARSLMAVNRLFPQLISQLPAKPKGGLKDGPVDALLIAGYGLRLLNSYSIKRVIVGNPAMPDKTLTIGIDVIGDFY